MFYGCRNYVIKLSKIIFKSPTRWIFITAFAFMPQFVFFASYVNNISVMMLGVAMTVYAWALGINDGRNYKNCFLLSVGISVCALSSYYSYGWILVSIFFVILSYLYQNKKDYKGLLKLFTFTFLMILIFTGYSFIRHIVVYKDILGLKTAAYYNSMYALEELLPQNNPSLSGQGLSLKYMLFDLKWIEKTFNSSVAVFGQNDVYCSQIVYTLAKVFIAVGIIGFIVKIIQAIIRRQKPEKMKMLFSLCLVLCTVITVILSICRSYYARKLLLFRIPALNVAWWFGIFTHCKIV